jgi:hypothetical protein
MAMRSRLRPRWQSLDELAVSFEIFESVMRRNFAFGGKLHKLSLRHAAKLRRPAERNRAFTVQLQGQEFRHLTRAEAGE